MSEKVEPWVVEFPIDLSRDGVFEPGIQPLSVPANLVDALLVLSRREGVPLSETLLAAFHTLLHRYTSEVTISIGLPTVPIPDSPSTRPVLLVAIREFTDDPSFRELLGRTRVEPLERPVLSLPPTNTPRSAQAKSDLSAVAAVVFGFGDVSPSEWASGRYDLGLWLTERAGELTGALQYDTELLDGATIQRVGGHLLTLLEGVTATPDQRVGTLPLLTPSERHRVLVEWNETETDYPRDKTLHGLFQEQAERTPDAEAVVFGRERLTYRELNERANRLAWYLQKRGVGPDVLVGLCIERSLEMVVALLGILKAGGAYVPLDPEYPAHRLAFMLEDTGAPVVLTEERVSGTLTERGFERVRLDADWPQIARESPENPPARATPDHLAYVIYTSGSTGVPKGVAIEHRGICNRLLWMQDAYRLTNTDRILQKTPFSFDVSVWEFFWPLLNGACLVVAAPGEHRDSARLAERIAQDEITIVHFVPPMLRVFLEEAGVERCGSLRQVICSGEALPQDLPERFFERLDARLDNLYGPTEASVDVTFWPCEPGCSGQTVPIGRPIANTQIYVLDRNLRPVPIGVPGELWIGGVGLARGYLKRPELTAEKFVANPFRASPGARIYRSGDVARFRSDGNLEFLGRGDDQVKIRGFRIELGEIESVLARHPAVRQCVVVAPPDGSGERRLVAYLVVRDRTSRLADLRAFVKRSLPEHMVPTVFVPLDRLPLTPSGKVDRRALPAPDTARREIQNEFVAPRSEIEQRLARIWEKALGIAPIGLRDDFFELGGHSLVAARMFAEIQKSFRKNLSPARLLQAPTIEQLAVLLGGEQEVPRWSSLVPIQPAGSQIPLFCIHAGAGTILFYYDLARELGSDQPVYGLQAQGLYGEFPPYSTVEEMARHYIQELRTIRPRGPYALAGFCFGAILAFEMAHQLQEQGQDVNLLVSLDGPAPRYDYSADPISSPAKSLKSRISEHWARFMELGLREKASYVLEKLSNQCIERTMNLQYRIGELYRVRGRPVPAKTRRVYFLVNHAEAERKYVPKVYPGRMVVFRSDGVFHDSNLGWEGLVAGGLHIYSVPGAHRGHRDLMTGAFIEAVSGRLRKYLNPAKDRHEAASRTA